MKAGERRARAIIDALLAAPEGMTQTPLMESIGLVPEGASRAARTLRLTDAGLAAAA